MTDYMCIRNEMNNANRGRWRCMEERGRYRKRKKRAQQTSVTAKTERAMQIGNAVKLGRRGEREMQKHQDQIKPDIPEHSGAMHAEFKEGIELDLFVGPFRGSALVVHGLPCIAAAWGSSVETNVIRPEDGAGPAEFGIGAGIIAGTLSIVVKRVAELGVLAAKIITVGLHFETG